MQELLAIIAKGLVDDPDSVSVEVDAPSEDGTTVYHIHVAENDMGRIIGKQGRIAKAIRTIARSAAIRSDEKIMVEID
ncbi:KH domain-containing protein [uncultured Ruminococcus sp.]|uniref:KH domain-containing protein n=1 Tax=uncultured Ruminococcus sp. TaxID=165186 RepID=UPI0025DEB32F|nr:KH domain-containing protein [uncultured Ruminococcus sp.]